MVRGIFFRVLAFGAAAAAASPQAVTAQDTWPDGPIQIVVPWSAGGATDAVMRVLAGEVSKALEVPVTVINQTGARGTVGTNAVITAPHEGNTWASGACRISAPTRCRGCSTPRSTTGTSS